MNSFILGLQKITTAFENEQIGYMIVGGFAVSFYNRSRFTVDIDIVLQIYPHHVPKITKYFPEWQHFNDSFKESAEKGMLFNITDFETGVKYDFMPYKDSDYNWQAFERRKKVDFLGVDCYIASPEDLIIAKLQWYHLSKSEKQLGDLNYLLNLDNIDMQYLNFWTAQLNIKRYGLF